MTPTNDQRPVSARDRETRRLHTQIENQARHIEAVERRLREALGEKGVASKTVEILDAMPRRPTSADVRHPAIPRTGPRELRSTQPPAPVPWETANRPWWPSARAAPPPLQPTPGWGCYTLRGRVGKVLGISVYGMEREQLASVVELVARQQRKARDFIPVFLTSSMDLELFRAHGFVFEYLPGADAHRVHSSSMSWEDYVARRLELVSRKWNITRVICFGPQAIGSW